jgi:hypothetical protein
VVLDHVAYIVQDLYSRGFHKLVPLAKDSHTPNLGSGGVVAIADDPKYWNPSKLTDNYHKFHNIATTFGPMVLSDGSIVYNHCLDVDSPSIMEILEPYMEEIKKLTYIVKTKKGIHIHWKERTQHERIGSPSSGRHMRRSIAGFDFEIKTDHRGGTAHLPLSAHRDDIREKNPNPFRYHRLEGSADKVALIDNFMGSGLGFYDWLLRPEMLGQYVSEPGASAATTARTKKKEDPDNGGRSLVKQESESDEKDSYSPSSLPETEEEEEEPAHVVPMIPPGISKADIHFSCADRLHTLVDEWYVKDYRNDIMLTITGTIRRSWYNIALEDAEKIIERFCEIAQDEEPQVRLTTLRTTYEAQDLSQIAGFGHLEDIIEQVNPDISEGDKKEKIDQIRFGFYSALANFAANNILLSHSNLKINHSAKRYIVVFDYAIEEVEFPEQFSNTFKEMIRTSERKSLLLNAAPMKPIEEIWDPIYNQTKYRIVFRNLGKGGNAVISQTPRPMTIDELEEWLRLNASYYHKPGRLAEALHAMIDAYNKGGYVTHKIETDIKGLVYLPTERGDGAELKLQLCNMERPPKPTHEEARACIELIKKIKTDFYSARPIDAARYVHFLKIGIPSVVDFARRQVGVVENYDIIPRQDLSGWTFAGKTHGYAAIPLRIYDLPLTKLVNVDSQKHSHVVSSGSIDTVARFIEQTLWTTFPVIFDEADRYSNWEDDKEAYKIVNTLKSSVMLTNPRDTLTSDSEVNIKPSAAFVILTHNSPMISEDGFSRRSDGHEFTYADMKTTEQKEKFNQFWADQDNRYTFSHLGRFCINYYLDNSGVLYNTHKDIAKILLQNFCELAGYTKDEFDKEWDSWLGLYVVSANSKEALMQARKEKVISMLRKMINEAWVSHRQPAAIWIAKNKGLLSGNPLDKETGKEREEIDKITSEATFEQKLEALAKTNNLTYLVWHETAGVTIDSSIVTEIKRSNITGVSLKGLGDLLGFECGPVRFSDGVKKVVHASVKEFADKLAPCGAIGEV